MSKKVKKQIAPKASFTDAQVIRLLVKENPKRGHSRERFALYRHGLSVQKYISRSVASATRNRRKCASWHGARDGPAAEDGGQSANDRIRALG